MWPYYLAAFVISLVVAYATAPKPQKPKPAIFADFDFPQTEDGTPQYVIFGDVWIADWIVLKTDKFRVAPIKRKGGK